MSHRERSCESKMRYQNRGSADAALDALKRNTGTTEWVRVYRCGFCGDYHIGRATKFVLSRLRIVRAD